jgi:ribokinase
MKGFDVIGFGALNADRLFKVNRIAAADEESFVTEFSESCGGSAANTVVGLARLGCKVGFIGKVSKDQEGKILLDDLRMEGVNTSGIIVSTKGRSGKVMGFVDQRGERALYVDPGVNDSIGFEEIDKEYVHQASFLHLTSFAGATSFRTQKRIVEIVPEQVRISLDPGAIYARIGLVTLELLVKRSFVFMPNGGELELLTNKSDYENGARFLLKKGVKIVAVKLGSKGCYVTDGKESHLIPSYKVRVTDTTGAGDAFCAGFLYGLVKGKSLHECGFIGNFVASKCVTRMGARAGLPTFRDLVDNKLA